MVQSDELVFQLTNSGYWKTTKDEKFQGYDSIFATYNGTE